MGSCICVNNKRVYVNIYLIFNPWYLGRQFRYVTPWNFDINLVKLRDIQFIFT